MSAKRKLIAAAIVAAIGAALIVLSVCRANKIHDDGNYATATTTVTPPATKR